MLLIYSIDCISDFLTRGTASNDCPIASICPRQRRKATKMDKRQNTKNIELYGLLAVPLSLLITVLFAGMILG